MTDCALAAVVACRMCQTVQLEEVRGKAQREGERWKEVRVVGEGARDVFAYRGQVRAGGWMDAAASRVDVER